MRLAVIGTGFAETHLEWINEVAGLRVQALCYNRDEARAETLAGRFGIATVSDSVSSVLKGGDIDAVVVVSPPYTHEQIIGEALAQGMRVVCDKPLSASVASASRMVEIAAATGMTGFVMFQWRVHPAFQRARNILASGTIGRVVHLALAFQHDFMAGPMTGSPWRHAQETAGGGALGDMGVHLFDLLRFLRPGAWSVSGAVGLVATLERAHGKEAIPCATEDLADVHLVESKGHCNAAVSVSRIATGLRSIRVTIIGMDGTIDIALSPEDGSGDLTTHTANQKPETHTFAPGAANPYRVFAAQLTTQSDADSGLATFQDGLAAQELMEQALALIAR